MPRRSARKASRRSKVLAVPADRFAAGRRLALHEFVPELAGEEEPLMIDLVRPVDLVALTIEAHGLELFAGASETVLRPRQGAEARLVVGLTFQHMAEEAIYEQPAPVPDEKNGPDGPPVDDTAPVDGDGARPQPPIPARPARASRVVLEVPEGERIPFSTEGLLAALGRLPLVVHPLARPGEAPAPRQPAGGPLLILPGGLAGRLLDAGISLETAARRLIPDSGTAEGASALARDMRRVRSALATEAGVAPRSVIERTPPGARAISIGEELFEIPPLVGPGGLVLVPGLRPRPRTRPELSRPPKALETAIEAPYRLVISPSGEAGWAHSTEPVAAEGAPHRVELWHTRLGLRELKPDDTIVVDERKSPKRIVRAVWARDRERLPGWESLKVAPHDPPEPFRTSLDSADRHMLVRQSAETWLGVRRKPIPPVPVAARSLWLSALGAWLDLHGQWETLPYSGAGIASILTWDHVAPLGRDQYVRVVYPGYLYPFGHQAALVKLTERKMKDAAPSLASLYQRMFLVIGDPLRRYDYDEHRDLPFTEMAVRPLVTPTLDLPPPNAQNTFFWPEVGGQRFRFVLDSLDHEGRPKRLVTPLMWVAEHNLEFDDIDAAYSGDGDRVVAAQGQKIAFTPVRKGGDTAADTESVAFLGKARLGGSRPRVESASVSLPAVQALSAVGPVEISYSETYKGSGFGGAVNSGEVWAEVKNAPKMAFGEGAPSGSDKAGGFLAPELPVAGLSRLAGAVGDPDGIATSKFDPSAFLAGALPKLFGLVPLDELVQEVEDLTGAPTVLSEALDRIEAFVHDLEQAKAAVAEAVADAERLVDRAADKANEIKQEAQNALNEANSLKQQVEQALAGMPQLPDDLTDKTEQEVEQALDQPLDALRDAVEEMEKVAPKLPPLVRSRLQSLAAVLREILGAADLIADVWRFVNGFDPSSLQARFRYEWRPELASWPPGEPPILEVKPDSLVLAVEGRASGKGEMGAEVLAELRDFTLHLLPGEQLVRIPFEHLSFKSGSSGKSEVDVVVGEIEFLGLLGFVETIKDLIPLDGFSDPPYLEVSPEGLEAGFTLALPNLAIGVFSLSNLSLAADLQVPFLGKTVTVGFSFCSRERPFTLAVTFIGGGGWFLVRVSPDGLDVLELGLEAGATLSIDLGVASGSVSAMLGIYMRLEGEKGSLTGYFRLRGEVDVIGLISASIELYLELKYEFDTGKMIGRATITVEVEVFVFSGTVKISAERRFAGANGDPTFAELMAVTPNGRSEPWTDYCEAFA